MPQVGHLAFGVAPSENGEHSAWMFRQFRVCFPHVAIVMQDEGTGLNSLAALDALVGASPEMVESASQMGVDPVQDVYVANCVRHMEVHIKGRHGSDAIPIMYQLARARSLDAVNAALEDARKYSVALFGELDAKKERISLFYRLAAGLMSGGIITQSNAEAMNNAIQNARGKGCLGLVDALMGTMRRNHETEANAFALEKAFIPASVHQELLQSIRSSKKYRIETWHHL
jgi:hypothetical protein